VLVRLVPQGNTNACAGEFDGRRLHVAFHGVLAADIHRRGRTIDFAVRRRDLNDAAFVLRRHSPNLVLHAQKHTKHICVEDGLIVLGGYIGSRAAGSPRRPRLLRAQILRNHLCVNVSDFIPDTQKKSASGQTSRTNRSALPDGQKTPSSAYLLDTRLRF
jgi:hypothetical protein